MADLFGESPTVSSSLSQIAAGGSTLLGASASAAVVVCCVAGGGTWCKIKWAGRGGRWETREETTFCSAKHCRRRCMQRMQMTRGKAQANIVVHTVPELNKTRLVINPAGFNIGPAHMREPTILQCRVGFFLFCSAQSRGRGGERRRRRGGGNATR